MDRNRFSDPLEYVKFYSGASLGFAFVFWYTVSEPAMFSLIFGAELALVVTAIFFTYELLSGNKIIEEPRFTGEKDKGDQNYRDD